LTSSNGCDSSVILALQVLPLPVLRIEPIDPVLCNLGDPISLFAIPDNEEWSNPADSNMLALFFHTCDLSFLWNTGDTTNSITQYPTATTFYTVIATSSGCSSTASQLVIVNPIAPVVVYDTLCYGETYTSFGFNETTSGTYSTTIENDDCEVSLTVHLFVHSPTAFHITGSVCAGEWFTEHGFHIALHQAGIFRDTLHFISHTGCDSIVTLEITVYPADEITLRDIVCQYLPYNQNEFTLPVQNIAGEFIHTRTVKTAHDCDSTITLKLTVNPITTYIISDEIEVGEPYHKYNFSFPPFNTAKDTTAYQYVTSSLNCDSTVVLNLRVVDTNYENAQDDYMQVLTCYPSTILDVFLNDTIIPCNRNEIILTIISGSKIGAHTSVNNDKNIIYSPATGFIGHDTLEYRVICHDVFYTAIVFITVVKCPDNIVEVECWGVPPATEWNIREVETNSLTTYSAYQPVLIGDIDGDGKPELIVINDIGNNDANTVYILDHNAEIKKQFSVPTAFTGASPLSAIGKVKISDSPEIYKMLIFYFATSTKNITAYDIDGNIEWISSAPCATTPQGGVAVLLADLDGDGWVELVAGNKVYAAESGKLLLDLQGSSAMLFTCASHIDFLHSSVGNVLNNGKQQICSGNAVYDVTITNRDGTAGNTYTTTTVAPVMFDGIALTGTNATNGCTQLVDLNLDGYLDVVVSTVDRDSLKCYVYVWTPLTGEIIASAVINNVFKQSIPFLGDIDGNGYPEIVFVHGRKWGDDIDHTTDKITALKYNPTAANKQLNIFWQIDHDDTSGFTGITLFDFNQDGISELVYRDEQNLRIINGSMKSHITGADTTVVYDLARIACRSGTALEYPVIADIDGDGQAEIIIVGHKTTNMALSGPVRIFKAGIGNYWAPARKVWNQYAYNAVNINEDLSIPRYTMSPATVFPGHDGVFGTADDVRPYNGFLMQQTILNQNGIPFWPMPNIVWTQEPTITLYDDSAVFEGCIKNIGDAALQAPSFVTYYLNDTLPENIISVDSINHILMKDSTYCFQLVLDNLSAYSLAGSYSIWLSFNDKNGIYPYQPQCKTDGRRELPLSQTCRGLELSSSEISPEGCVELEWHWLPPAPTDTYGFTLYQWDEVSGIWQTTSTNYNKIIQVLNVYPDIEQSNTLKGWMDDLEIGLGKIIVTPVAITDFNANPDLYLKPEGEYIYDAIMFGSWDENYVRDLTPTSATVVRYFLNSGRGVLFGHDTQTSLISSGSQPNFVSLRDKTNLDIDPYDERSYLWRGDTSIKVCNDGFLLKYPHNIPYNSILSIPPAHSTGQLARGVVWMNFPSVSIFNNPVQIMNGGTNDFYLTTWNNAAMIQTGHSNGAATPDEQRVLANTLWYLAQFTTDTTATVCSALDLAAPDTPTVNRLSCNQIEMLSNDNGSLYRFYVKATHTTNEADTCLSNILEVINKSSLKGFYVLEDDHASGIPETSNPATIFVAAEDNQLVTYITQNVAQYIHVQAIDSAGNLSEVVTLDLSEYQVSLTQISDTIFDNEFYNFYGEMLNESGVYYHTLLSTHGCDSIIELTLTVITKTYDVRVSALIGGTAIGTGTNIPNGTPWEVEAFPIYCYTFLEWTEDGNVVSSDNPYSFYVTEDRDLVAHFEFINYEITLSASPPQGGSVSGEGLFPCNAVATVNAITNDCWEFVNWISDDGTLYDTNEDFTFAVTGNMHLTAHFKQKSYNILTIANPPEGGLALDDRLDTPCGDTIILMAIPAPCYTFVKWTTDKDTITQAIHLINVFDDAIWTAHFEPKEYQILVHVNPPDEGCIATGSGNYTCSDSVTVEAYPADCYEFLSWTINNEIVSTNPFYTFAVTAGPPDPTHIIANFQKIIYQVIVSAEPPTAGNVFVRPSIHPDGQFRCGDSVVVLATPIDCYRFAGWTEFGDTVSLNPEYRFIISNHRNLVANFILDSYYINVMSNPPNGGQVGIVSGGNSYNCGDSVTIVAAPADCFRFICWTKGNDTVSFNSSYRFTVTESSVFIANFERYRYNVTVEAIPPDGGTVFGGGTFFCDTTTTVTAIVSTDGCYVFDRWEKNGSFASNSSSYTFPVTENSVMQAFFVKKPIEVSVYSNPPDGGTVTGGGNHYQCGDTATVTATPNGCFEFLYWTKNDTIVSNDTLYKFEVTEPVALVAHFKQKTVNVTLSSNPPNVATLIFNEGNGIYNCGAYIKITAIPDECYTFVNWTENGDTVSTENPWSFNVTEDRDLVANFVQNPFIITIITDPFEGGSVSWTDSIIPCISGGTPVSVEAFPDTCYSFAGWKTTSGFLLTDNNLFSFYVTKSDTLVAHFEIKTFSVTLSAAPFDGGTVWGGDANIPCDSFITINAESDSCFIFIGWKTLSGDSVSMDNPYQFNVTEDWDLVAHFEKIKYDIILSAVPTDGGVVFGDSSYYCGDTISVKAIPNDCYSFINWTENGEQVSADSIYTFEVTEARYLTANFTLNSFNVTAVADPIAAGTAAGGGNFICSDTATLTATLSNVCYSFAGWWIQGGEMVSADNPYSFVVTEDIDLVARFVDSVKITVFVNPSGAGMVAGTGYYSCYDTAIVIASSIDPCYTFVNWTDGVNAVSTDSIYLFVVVGSRDLVANFKPLEYNIFTFSNPAGGGTTNGGGVDISCDSTVCLTAIPAMGYNFINWTEAGGDTSTNNPHCYQAFGNAIWTAHFEPKTYEIITLPNPPYGGTTQGDTTCKHGDLITVNAFPADCYEFVNWMIGGVAISSNPIYSFHALGPLDTTYLIANFQRIVAEVIVSAEPPTGGTVYLTPGIQEEGFFRCGDTVNVMAQPKECYLFAGWTENGDTVSYNLNYQFIITEDRNLVANFKLETYQIIVATNPENGGEAEIIGGGNSFNCGDSLTVVATPADCFRFLCWTKGNDTVSFNSSYHFTVTETCILIANFERKTYEVIVQAIPPDGGTVFGGGIYFCDTTATVTAIVSTDGCYVFDRWERNTVLVSTNSAYSFSITENTVMVAYFKKKPVEISVSSNPPDGGTVTGGGNHYQCGDTASVTATPNGCFKFLYWTKNDTIVSYDTIYKFEVTEPVALVAQFERDSVVVTLSSNPTGAGILIFNEGNGTYNCGEYITITAVPLGCYTFVNWTDGISGDTVSIENPWSFNVTENISLVANFTQNPFIITIITDPFEGGAVSWNDSIIPCISGGTSVSVEAFPNACYSFAGWWTKSGNFLSYYNPYSFNVTKSDTLVAHFEIKTFTVTLSADPFIGGMVSGGGTDLPCDSLITINAESDSCYTFIGWKTLSGDSVSMDNPYQFNVTEDWDLVAHFEKLKYDITLSADPADGGVVYGDSSYYCGEIISVIATPADDCWDFVNWKENGVEQSTDSIYTFEVTEERVLVAHFIQKTFNVTAVAQPSGYGTVTGAGNYFCGDTATLTATLSNPCYSFKGWWTLTGDSVSINNPYTFIVTEAIDLVAHFVDSAKITVIVNPADAGFVTGGGYYSCYQVATVTATVTDDCYFFTNWTNEDGVVVNTNSQYVFQVVGSRTLTANFERKPLRVLAIPNPYPGGTVSPQDTTYLCGDTAKILAIPNPYYHFVNWTKIDGTVVSEQALCELPVIEMNVLYANFAKDMCEIVLIASPQTGGTLTGGGTYDCGNLHSVVALANPGYTFLNWTRNDTIVSVNEEYSFTVEAPCPHILIAYFIPNNYNIEVSWTPDPGGVAFSTSNPHAYGDMATCTAIPLSGYNFIHWTENDEVVSGVTPYIFEVTGDRNLVAHFSNSYIINLQIEPQAACGDVSGGGYYNFGETVTLVADYPSLCCQFLGWWEGALLVSSENPYSFEVTGSRTIVAKFESITFNVVLQSSPPEGGSATGGGSYCDTSITVTAIPVNDCWKFVEWRENGTHVNSNNPYQFNVTEDRNLVAHFEKFEYEITLSANPQDGGVVTGDGNYECGETITVTATPNTGYNFMYWTENGIEINSAPAAYTFLVETDRHLVAHFEQKIFTVTLDIHATGDSCSIVEVQGSGTYQYGDIATVEAIVVATEGCCGFDSWTENGVVISTENPFKFEVTKDINLVANFKKPNYLVTLLVNEEIYGRTDSTKSYEACTEARVRAYEKECYRFANWTTTDGTVVSTDFVYKFKVTNDITLIANFKALEFDEFCHTLWFNTFELDLLKLNTIFEVVGCSWYKNGDTVYHNTINQFSYSAGPNEGDYLECEPTWYMYKLTTKDRRTWCSTRKSISDKYFQCTPPIPTPPDNLVIFPNPTMGNNAFTVENVIKGEEVRVYNQYGICIKSLIANAEILSMSLDVASGVYIIRCNERYGKIVIIKY